MNISHGFCVPCHPGKQPKIDLLLLLGGCNLDVSPAHGVAGSIDTPARRAHNHSPQQLLFTWPLASPAEHLLSPADE
jgi:hypothetical protein